MGQISPPFGEITVIEETTTEVKVAVQVLAALMVTCPSRQSTSPLQPAKTEPGSGVAANVTTAPLA
jgi:hypothetical protein